MLKIPDFKNLSNSQATIVIGLVALIIGGGILVYFNLRPSETANQAKLSFWGTESGTAFESALEGFKNINKGVEISYRQIPESSYEETLINALAAGTGPDLFLLPNTDLPKNKAKIVPFDPAKINLLKFQEQYPQIAEQDFVAGG